LSIIVKSNYTTKCPDVSGLMSGLLRICRPDKPKYAYRTYTSIKKLNNPEYFNTWLTRITINCSLNALKKKKKVTESEIQVTNEEITSLIVQKT